MIFIISYIEIFLTGQCKARLTVYKFCLLLKDLGGVVASLGLTNVNFLARVGYWYHMMKMALKR